MIKFHHDKGQVVLIDDSDSDPKRTRLTLEEAARLHQELSDALVGGNEHLAGLRVEVNNE